MDFQELWVGISILIPSLAAVFVIYFDLKLKRKREKEEVDTRKAIQEEELKLKRITHEENLKFEKQKFDEEKQERDDRRKWLRREYAHLSSISEPIAENIVRELKRDTKWASESLEKAKLGPYSQSIFGERVGHFSDEKEHIAKHFVPLLIKRCKALIAKGNEVSLLIDSGTTLYPFFEIIAREAVRANENKEDWLKHLLIATNNLPGIQKMMEMGRANPNNRYSLLAVKCLLFPGEPLPVYSAVTGDQTTAAVSRLKGEAGHNHVFISLVVGNWIRIRRTDPKCPVPLARGLGHLEFKQALIQYSDEIYVVTPLGKVFCDVSEDQLNNALGLIPNIQDPDRQSYREVNTMIDGKEAAERIKIVSTSRNPDRILFVLSNLVKTILDANEAQVILFENAEVGKSPHVIIPFNWFPNDKHLEFEIEFPHSYTQEPEFVSKYRYTKVY